jgi:S1-C subfamily serine protease
MRKWIAAVALACPAGTTLALTPEQVFEKVSPSVWAVRALDAAERPFSLGSGVVIGPGRVVTNCHVLARARSVQVRRENVTYEARLEHADAERDLCILSIASFNAPPVATVAMAELKVGQRVYAVGNPEKLALTLSEGLISGLRTEDPKLPPIQTSAAISQGSSGGGLFDAEGRLVGITTLIVVGRSRIAQNLNFALPAEWIGEVPERARAALAARRAPAAATTTALLGAPGLPAPGTRYRYAWSDVQIGAREEFSVQVTSVDGESVNESYAAQGKSSTSSFVQMRMLDFLRRPLSGTRVTYEFAPYFPAEAPPDPQAIQAAFRYPFGETSVAGAWTISVTQPGWESVTVPAGTFKAYRMDIRGSRPTYGIAFNVTKSFSFSAWYAPDVKRVVKYQHERSGSGGRFAYENVELLEFAAK